MKHNAMHNAALQLIKSCSAYRGLEESPIKLLRLALVIKSLDINTHDLACVAESVQYNSIERLRKLAQREELFKANYQTLEPISEDVLLRAKLVYDAWCKRYPNWS